MSPPPVGGHLAELSEVGHQLVCKEPQQAFGISPPFPGGNQLCGAKQRLMLLLCSNSHCY